MTRKNSEVHQAMMEYKDSVLEKYTSIHDILSQQHNIFLEETRIPG